MRGSAHREVPVKSLHTIEWLPGPGHLSGSPCMVPAEAEQTEESPSDWDGVLHSTVLVTFHLGDADLVGSGLGPRNYRDGFDTNPLAQCWTYRAHRLPATEVDERSQLASPAFSRTLESIAPDVVFCSPAFPGDYRHSRP